MTLGVVHSCLDSPSWCCWLIVALRRQMVTEIWVNIGSGNGLLPDGTKPLPDAMDFSLVKCFGIHLRAVSQELLINFRWNMCLEIALLKLLPHLSAVNELNSFHCHFWVMNITGFLQKNCISYVIAQWCIRNTKPLMIIGNLCSYVSLQLK